MNILLAAIVIIFIARVTVAAIWWVAGRIVTERGHR